MTYRRFILKLLTMMMIILGTVSQCRGPTDDYYLVTLNQYYRHCYILQADADPRLGGEDDFADWFFAQREEITCIDDYSIHCAQAECFIKNQERFLPGQVCINDGNNYPDVVEYCKAKMLNEDLDYEVCGEGECLISNKEDTRCFDYEVQKCEKEIGHDGPICECSYLQYRSKTEYCEARVTSLMDEHSLMIEIPYFHVAPCLLETPLPNGEDYQYAGENEIIYKYLSLIGGSLCTLPYKLYNKLLINGQACYMERSEYVYRSYARDLPNSTVTGMVGSVPNIQKCCEVECQSEHFEMRGGCGSDKKFYTDRDSFCMAFCQNRTLKLTPCGTGECVHKNVSQCPTNCQINAPNVPVCGDDWEVYPNEFELCRALDSVAKTIDKYYLCKNEQGCTECSVPRCIANELERHNYTSNYVCDTNGLLHYTHDSFCSALIKLDFYTDGDDRTHFILCDGKPCKSDKDCLMHACLTKYENIEGGFCSMNRSFGFYQGRYFENARDYCHYLYEENSWLSTLDHDEIYACRDGNCNKSECQLQFCLNTPRRDYVPVCDPKTFKILDLEQYCHRQQELPDFKPVICLEFANGTQIPCENDLQCTGRGCNHIYKEMGVVFDENLSVCTQEGIIVSLDEFCFVHGEFENGKFKEPFICDPITSNCFIPSPAAISERIPCCIQSCLQKRFENIPFQPGCSTKFFEWHPTIEHYCESTCIHEFSVESLTPSLKPLTMVVDDNGDLLDEDDCCEKRCLHTKLPFCIFIEPTSGQDYYSLIDTSSECTDFCAKNTIIKTCSGAACTQDDCDHFTCMHNLEGSNFSGYCSYINGNDLVFHTSKADYCDRDVATTGPFFRLTCTDSLTGNNPSSGNFNVAHDCVNLESCKYSYCLEITSWSGSVCDDSNNFYNNVEEYCYGYTFNAAPAVSSLTKPLISCCKDSCLATTGDFIVELTNFGLIPKATYCEQQCNYDYNADSGTKTDFGHIHICYEDNGTLRACARADAYYQSCLVEIRNSENDDLDPVTVCAYDTGFTYNSHYAATDEDFCDEVKDILTSHTTFNTMSTLLVECDNCDDAKCCLAACEEGTTSYINVCGENSNGIFELYEIADSCEDYCTDGSPGFVSTDNCDGNGCSQDDCEFMTCMKKLEFLIGDGTVCLFTEEHDRHIFYEDKEAYCTAVADSDEWTSDPLKPWELLCQDGNCPSERDCCIKFCMSKDPATPEYGACSFNLQDFTEAFVYNEKDVYCTEMCDSNNYSLDNIIDECGAGDAGKCNENNCAIEQCNLLLEDRFKRPQCYRFDDKNFMYFDNVLDFNKMIGEPEGYCPWAVNKENLNVVAEFGLSDLYDYKAMNWMLYGLEKDCCVGHCLSYLDYMDACDANFRFLSKKHRCQLHCQSDLHLNFDISIINDCGDVPCTEIDCHVKKCINDIDEEDEELEVCYSKEISGKHFLPLREICIHEYEVGTAKINGYPFEYNPKHHFCDIVIDDDVECTTAHICCVERCMLAYPDTENYVTCHNEGFDIITPRERCDFNCRYPDPSYKLTNDNLFFCETVGGDPRDCDINDCRVLRCVDDLNKYTTLDDKEFCAIDPVFGQDTFENLTAYCRHIVDNSSSENFNLPGLIDLDEFADYTNKCCVAKCSIEDYNTGCREGTFEQKTILDYCEDRCNSDNYKFLQCDDKDCAQSDCEIMKCISALGANASGNFDGSICLKDISGTLEFHDSARQYCTGLIDEILGQASVVYPTDYTISAAPLSCDDSLDGNAGNDKRCMNLEECCFYDCLSDTTNSVDNKFCRDAPDFDYVTAHDKCNDICRGIGEVDYEQPEFILCYDSDGSERACNDKNCGVEKCKTNNTDIPFPICIESNWNGRNHHYTDLQEYCEEITGVDDVNLGIDPNNVNNVTSEDRCCRDKCNFTYNDYTDKCNTSNYQIFIRDTLCANICDGGDFATINADKYDCGEDCQFSDCLYLKCKNDNSSLTGQLCVSKVYYTDIEDYCHKVYPNITSTHDENSDFTINNNLLCAGNSECNDLSSCELRFCEENSDFTVNKCYIEGDYTLVTSDTQECEIKKLDDDATFTTCDSGTCTQELCTRQFCLDSSTNTINGSGNLCLLVDTNVTEFYTTEAEFCDAYPMQSDYTSLMTFIKCIGPACTRQACDVIACKSIPDADYSATCSLIDYSLITVKDNFCDTVGTNPDNYLTCEGGCTANECAIQKCLNDIDHIQLHICLADPIGSIGSQEYYFDSQRDYCQFIIDNGATDYTLSNHLIVDPAVGTIDDNKDCCYQRCLQRPYHAACNLEDGDQAPLTQETYCNDLCDTDVDATFLDLIVFCVEEDQNTGGTYINMMENSVEDCEIRDCQIKALSYDLRQTHPGIVKVCAASGTLYDTIEEYVATELNNHDSSAPVTDIGGFLITDANECKLASCLSDNSNFAGGCSTTNYVYLPDSDAFCNFLHTGGVYTEYMIDGVVATQDECNIEFCIENNSAGTKVCADNSYVLLTLSDNCVDAVLNSGTDYTNCFGGAGNVIDCTLQDCQEMRCEAEFSEFSDSEMFCSADDDNNYTKSQYCSQKAGLFPYEYYLCLSPCNSRADCLKEKCMVDNAEKTFPTCADSDNTILFEDVEEYCEYVKNNGATTLNDNIDALTCCTNNCNADTNNFTRCTLEDDSNTITKAVYCPQICNPNIEAQLYVCDGKDCTADDCLTASCLFNYETTFEETAFVCGSNDAHYLDIETFCAAKIADDTIKSVLCGGEECQNLGDPVTACCASTCTTNHEDAYVPRCDQDKNWLEDVFAFCTSKCQNDAGDGYSDLTCGGALCTEKECCVDKCDDQTDYKPTCHPDTFAHLDLNAYCDLYCPGETFTPITCDSSGTGCSAAECDILNCIDTLSEPGKICLKTAFIGNDIFYADERALCSAYLAIGGNSNPVSIGDTYLCGGSPCVDEEACCKTRCNDDASITDLVRCKTSDWSTYTKAEYCDDFCNPLTSVPEIEHCTDNSVNISCTAQICNVMGCVDLLNYDDPNGNFCADNNNLSENFFTGGVNEFCDDYVTATGSYINVDTTTQIAKCSNTACADGTSCCAALCSLVSVNLVCATDGVVYDSVCAMNCSNNSPALNFACDTLNRADCEAVCPNLICHQACPSGSFASDDSSNTDTEQVGPVCASNGFVYLNTCMAECDSTVNFDCSYDRLGEVRLGNCRINCSRDAGSSTIPEPYLEADPLSPP